MTPDQLDEWILSGLRSGPDAGTAALPTPVLEDDWNDIIEQATRHRITPLLYHRLRTLHPEIPVPDRITGKLRQAHLDNAARNLMLYNQLGRVLRLLRDHRIPVIAIKGAHLAEQVYAHPALRYMGDLDLLVRKDDLMKVDSLLVAAGCEPTVPNRIVGNDNNEFVYVMPRREVCLEIHWSILSPRFPFPIDTEGQWERSRHAVIAGVDAAVFCPEDILLHLCLHAGCTHGFEPGLKLFCDIVEIVRHAGATMDWQLVRRLTREWGIGKPVYLTLRLTRELLGVKIPEGYLDELCPDDFNECYITLARDQIFSRKPRTGPPLSMWPAVAEFWGASRLRDKAALLVKGFFLPKKVMARLYPVPSDSMRIYLYYVVRFRDLLRVYGRDGWRWLTRDKQMKDLARDGNDLTTLKAWLSSS